MAPSLNKKWLKELSEFLAIPSVSAPFDYHNKQITRAANWLVNHFKKVGFNAELLRGKYTPLVYAEWLCPTNKFTLLIYCHYDVQPADPIKLWRTPPFKMTVSGGKIYARGASDSKGHLFAYIKGIETVLKTSGKLPINIKFIVDGDEESAELALPDLINRNPQKLEADAVLIGAGAMLGANTPSICYAVRGLVAAEVKVIGHKINLHSGSFGGGIINPVEYLVKIISALKDKNKKITLPHFYDDVLLASSKNKPLSVFRSNKEFLLASGGKKISGETGFSLNELITVRPTFEINGISGGYADKGFQYIIPTEVLAKISFRLVPNQNPEKIYNQLIKFIFRYQNKEIKIELKRIDSAYPAIMNKQSLIATKAAETLKEIFDVKPVWFREGGAVPVVYNFQKLGKDVIMVGFGLPDDNIHAPNEKLNLSSFYREIEFVARLVRKLA
ncbi:MAG: M20/M25/M40 family metallo-hydrolase [Patescibacteria group bacterium]